VLIGGLCGCEAPRYGAVASHAVTGGVVSLWAPGGRLHSGANPVVIDIKGDVAGEIDVPPRLRFRKQVSGSGYSVEREARLRRSGPGRFSGEIRFPEPGAWSGRLEVAGETLAIEVDVE
jgi:hypothetical protein